jgi:hypothetical protein
LVSHRRRYASMRRRWAAARRWMWRWARAVPPPLQLYEAAVEGAAEPRGVDSSEGTMKLALFFGRWL